MNRDWTRIVPDVHDAAHDVDEYRKQHRAIFGHEPPADPDETCRHPMHAEIRRAMNGAQIDIPFDPHEIVSEDAAVAQAARERYGVVFQATQEFQAEVEAEEARERARAMGIRLFH